ncbi:MAG TPA: hypothetical protein VNC78_11410 [Actinomycetota bacterium]|nr:hypothetical protein [Actinomycetota bacterium]
MRRSLAAALVGVCALATGALPAGAGPAEGFNSANVEYIRHIPFEVATATGAKVIGNYLYVTSWKNFSIYDVSDPLNPTLVGTPVPFGFKFENEDVATNGKIMLFSESLPQSILHVWDVEDKSNPVQIAALSGAGQHTTDCILDCKYSYGSAGAISDLRDPSNPELVGNWGEGMPSTGSHDVNEVAPGLVLTSSRPIMLLDARKNPTKPKLLAVGDDEAITGGIHSNSWPRKAKDDFVLFSSESNATGRCSGTNGAFMVWDATHYKKDKTFSLVDIYQLSNGTFSDGSPPVNGLGCSAHWFQERPDFRNGGIVALGSYEHGTRFVEISKKGKISEVGYFLPNGGSTSAAYWLTNEIVYAVDYTRGIDVLRFTD